MPVPRQIAARYAKTLPSIVKWIQCGLADILRGRVEETNPDGGQGEAEEAADDGEQDAFHQQLPDDAPAARAKRDAHSDFTRAVRGPREQQIRDVGAGNEEHEADGAHQREKDRADRAAVDALVDGLDAAAERLCSCPDSRWVSAGRSRGARPAPAPRDTPGARRPKTSNPRALRYCFSRSGTFAIGCHRSAFCGNLKPSGITPIDDRRHVVHANRASDDRRDRCRSGSSRRRCRAARPRRRPDDRRRAGSRGRGSASCRSA